MNKVTDIVRALSNLPEPEYEGQRLVVPITQPNRTVPMNDEVNNEVLRTLNVTAVKFWEVDGGRHTEWLEWYF